MDSKAIYLLLVFMIFLGFSCFFNYDFPQLFESQLINQFQINTVKLSFLYSIYSIPNVIFCSIISMAVNRLGLGYGGVLLTFIMVVGSYLQYFACKHGIFWMLLAARVAFGISGENMIVLI